MHIRTADKKDLPQLVRLARKTYVAAFGHSFTPADLAAHLDKNLTLSTFMQILSNDVVLIAVEKSGSLVGFIQFSRGDYPYDDQPYDGIVGILHRLYVDPDVQSRGIGRALMHTALAHPLFDRSNRIVLDVWEKNARAIDFYKRFGFKVVGSQKFEVESGGETSLDLILARDKVETKNG